MIDRPYSLWERVHGVTVGACFLDARTVPELWRAVGRELRRLHEEVRSVDDPRGWLDQPRRGNPLARRMAGVLYAMMRDGTSYLPAQPKEAKKAA